MLKLVNSCMSFWRVVEMFVSISTRIVRHPSAPMLSVSTVFFNILNRRLTSYTRKWSSRLLFAIEYSVFYSSHRTMISFFIDSRPLIVFWNSEFGSRAWNIRLIFITKIVRVESKDASSQNDVTYFFHYHVISRRWGEYW